MSEPEQHFTTLCPQCSSALRVRHKYLGQTVQCKQCGHDFLASRAEEPVTTAVGERGTESLARALPLADRVLVVCEKCKAALSVRTSRIGQVVRCKQCDSEILVTGSPHSLPAAGPTASGSSAAEDLLRHALGGCDDEKHKALESRCEQLQAELEKVRIAHNLLETEFEHLKPEHNLVEAENKRHRERIDNLLVEQAALRARESWISPEQAQTWDDERAGLRAEIEDLQQTLKLEHQNHEEQRATLRAEIEDLRQTLDLGHQNHDEERATFRAEIEDLRQTLDLGHQNHGEERATFRAEIEDLRQTLNLEQQNHQAELVRCGAEREEVNEQYRKVRRQLDSTELACKEYEERIHGLAQAQTRLESDHRSELESNRSRQAELEEQLEAHRVELATLRADVSRNVEDEKPSPDQASAGPDLKDELESNRAEIQTLRQRVSELEHLQSEMSIALGGLGIRRYWN